MEWFFGLELYWQAVVVLMVLAVSFFFLFWLRNRLREIEELKQKGGYIVLEEWKIEPKVLLPKEYLFLDQYVPILNSRGEKSGQSLCVDRVIYNQLKEGDQPVAKKIKILYEKTGLIYTEIIAFV